MVLRKFFYKLGIKSGIEGVFAAIEEGNYNLAAWRAATTIWAIMSLKSELLNKTICFTEDTLIYTKDGYKEIKDIEVGDEVYSENPETGEKGLKRVLNVFVNTTKELIHLKVGEQEIKTTANHPFWVEGIGWVDAGDLKLGDRLVIYSDDILEVKEAFVEYLDKPIKVYNFEVENWHTYFVTEYNVFVHKATCGDTGVGKNGGNTKSNGSYENAPYHGKNNNSIKNKAPNNGQAALDNSVSLNAETTPRRIGVSDGEIVVLDQTTEGVFHGHVRSWGELTPKMCSVLQKAGLVDKKGNGI